MSKSRFILLVGVLGWGIPCAVLFSWWMSSSQGSSFWLWLGSLPLWCAGGYPFGLILWKWLGYDHRPEARRTDAAADESRDRATAGSGPPRATRR